MRFHSQPADGEVRAIVAHGRMLLARAVRAAWQSRLLTRDPDGLFSSVLGARDVDELLASIDAQAATEAPVVPRERLARRAWAS